MITYEQARRAKTIYQSAYVSVRVRNAMEKILQEYKRQGERQDKLAKIPINRDLYARYLFFKENGGFVVGKRAICALELARAEIWCQDNNFDFLWEYDDIDHYGDHEYWCLDARRENAGYTTDGELSDYFLVYGRMRDSHTHEVLMCGMWETYEENGRGRPGLGL